MVLNDIHKLRKDLDNLELNYNALSITPQYQQTEDGINPPTRGTWVTIKPSPSNKHYIWVRNEIDTGNGKIYTEPYCIGQGIENIEGVDVEYYQNDSRINKPSQNDEAWSTLAPTHLTGKYIWSRTKIITNLGTKYSEPVCITGDTRSKGEDGVGIKGDDGNTSYLHIKYSDLNPPPDNTC